MSVEKRKPRVLVAMSGGVDSSVAAALLVDQGFDVIGATMQVWDYSKNKVEEDADCDANGTCCSSDDVDDARWVADQLGIPFYILNCEEQFQAEVIDPFIESYLSGETPIPCVNCNTFLKFSHLIQKMKELDCDYLATGHYAKIVNGEGGEQLIQTSEDGHKDQTYFLFTLNKEVIPKILFPVGDMNKSEVRKIAEEKKLVVAKKKDSIGICFIGKGGYKEFFSDHVAPDLFKKGPIVLYPENEVMGEHPGLHGFTYGQRKALGVSFSEPLFVKTLDMENNKLVLCREKDLYAHNVDVRDCNFFTNVAKGDTYRVKLRYQHKGADCTVENISSEGVKLKFNDPQRAITPGQAAVFYKNNNLVGGGWIV
ncbi:MAG: tRNA 2-thiouridine(34) synthase MnmA [Bdellovibrionales bacterium]